ncbi:MAG: energy transducer TonB [Gemmatimonadetes bacterium]|nr:energy transducer TonB [Gemmatimonadota bacterium]
MAPEVIHLEDIPETSQRRSAPRSQQPSVPLAVYDEDAPEDATIEITDLELDRIPLDLPIGKEVLGMDDPPEEEEIVELWKVEQKPELITHIAHAYPVLARRAGIEGVVYVNLLVGKDGKVLRAEVVKGLEVFHEAALDAVKQFTFSPGIQNDKAVKVWITTPLQFTLVENRGQ